MELLSVLLLGHLGQVGVVPTRRHPFWDSSQPLHLQANRNDDDGRPPARSRVGGGGRNPCLDVPIALVPGSDAIALTAEACQPASPADVALTQESTPTIWVYVPEYANSELIAELTLIQDSRALEQWTIDLPSSAGVICLRLPTKLEAEQLYEWQLAVQLTTSPADNPKVGGLLQYTEDDGEYWADALTTLGQQRLERPEEFGLAGVWEQLLAQQGLGAMSAAPLSSSCLSPRAA